MSSSKLKTRAPRRVGDSAFTLLELIVAMALVLLLASAALPLAQNQVKRAKEAELRRDLREMREAIDRYKLMADMGQIPPSPNTFNYPPDLKTLVEGVTLRGTAKGKYKFLRRIPLDPMTGTTDWGMRAMQDDVDSKSWGGDDVFDVYSKSDGIALDGTKYSDW